MEGELLPPLLPLSLTHPKGNLLKRKKNKNTRTKNFSPACIQAPPPLFQTIKYHFLPWLPYVHAFKDGTVRGKVMPSVKVMTEAAIMSPEMDGLTFKFQEK